MPESPLVSIVVVTMNTPRLTSGCLRAIRRNTAPPHEVIVVANSRAAAIRRALRRVPGVRTIWNPVNAGYTRAANQGALAARGRFICFLNSDALVPPGWLERLLAAAGEPGAGAVAPIPNGTGGGEGWPLVQVPLEPAATELVDRHARRLFGTRVADAPWLIGFCLLIPRAVMQNVGLFDERFFFGWEDIDYCFRLRRKGYRLLHARGVFVNHLGGGSSSSERRIRLVRNSRVHFLRKWAPFLGPGNVRYLKWRGGRRDPLEFDGGAFMAEIDRRVRAERAAELRRRPRPAPPPRLPAERPRAGPPLVSVMMVARDSERWIAEAVESVLSQRLRDFELLILDDASCDRTAWVARRYARHPGVRLLSNPAQLGIAASRNRVLAEARGRYVAVCDSDDRMLPSLLDRFAGILEARPRVDWVYADRITIDAEGRRTGLDPARPIDGASELRSNVIAHAGALIRRRAMLAAGGYDESYVAVEDYDLGLKMAERGGVLSLPGEVHYLWRRHAGSTSLRSPWSAIETERLLRLARERRARA